MSVGELRAVIEGAGMSHEDILDKQELRRRALAADESAATGDEDALALQGSRGCGRH